MVVTSENVGSCDVDVDGMEAEAGVSHLQPIRESEGPSIP